MCLGSCRRSMMCIVITIMFIMIVRKSRFWCMGNRGKVSWMWRRICQELRLKLEGNDSEILRKFYLWEIGWEELGSLFIKFIVFSLERDGWHSQCAVLASSFRLFFRLGFSWLRLWLPVFFANLWTCSFISNWVRGFLWPVLFVFLGLSDLTLIWESIQQSKQSQ